MSKSVLTSLAVSVLLAVCLPGPIAAAQTDASTPELPFDVPLKWKSSGILIGPVSDENHQIVAAKDPTVVRYDGKWHVYHTTANTEGHWSIAYVSFENWEDAKDAKPYYIDNNPNLRGYHCAPHVFYFRPHEKWYLVYQSQPPQYSTTDDISKPETWSAPQDFYSEKPANQARLWIDYWVICDDTHAYLFNTGDDGKLYRARTTTDEFPNGMGDPEIVLSESRNDLFEGSMTYKIKGMDLYLTLIEALQPARYYRAWVHETLDGEYIPVEGAQTWQQPFAGINNVTFEEGVERWTTDISHGELLRDGYDERMVIDPENLQLLFQGRHPDSGGRYSQLPYRLGLLTRDTSESGE